MLFQVELAFLVLFYFVERSWKTVSSSLSRRWLWGPPGHTFSLPCPHLTLHFWAEMVRTGTCPIHATQTPRVKAKSAFGVPSSAPLFSRWENRGSERLNQLLQVGLTGAGPELKSSDSNSTLSFSDPDEGPYGRSVPTPFSERFLPGLKQTDLTA